MQIDYSMATALLEPQEYKPYYERYLKLIALQTSPAETLREQWQADCSFWHSYPQFAEPYAPGKWSPATVVQHLIDIERIFQFRALTLAREESPRLPGFDHAAYAEQTTSIQRSREDLLEEWRNLRESGIALFHSLDQPGLLRQTGTVDGGPLSVRAAAYISAGHARHHLRILEQHRA